MISFSASSTAASQRPGIQFNRNTSTVTDQKRVVQAVVLCCVVLCCTATHTHHHLPINVAVISEHFLFLFHYIRILGGQIRSGQEMVPQR